MEKKGTGKGRVFFVLVTAQVLISASYLMAKVALREFSPLALGLFRFAIAAALMALIGRIFFPGVKIDKGDRKIILLMALLVVPLNQGFFLYAMQYAPSAHGALLYATTPIMVLALSALFLGEQPGWLKSLGIMLGFGGVILVLFDRGLRLSALSFKGDLLLLVAVFTWSVFTILNKRMVKKYPPFLITAKSLIWGSLLFLPVGLPFAVSQDYARIGWQGLGALAYLALMTSVLGYWAWSWGLSKIEASQVAVLSNIQPVLAALWGWALLGETITPRFLLGAAVVCAGVLIAESG